MTTKTDDKERVDFEAWASAPTRADKLPLDRWPTNGAYKDTRTYLTHFAWQARAAVEADRKQHFENGEALQRYKECGGDEESDPIERLRFYCSLAMSGQDWLDAESFFDALVADRQRGGEPVGIVKRPSESHFPGVQWIGDVRDGEHLYASPQPTEPVKVPSDATWPEALSEFSEGQWWVEELDAMVNRPGTSLDQKRAVAVVHHLLASVARYGDSQPAANAKPVVMKEICPDCGHQFECFHNPYINQMRSSSVAQEPDTREVLRMCVGPLNLALAMTQMHPGADNAGETMQQCAEALDRVQAILATPATAKAQPDAQDREDV